MQATIEVSVDLAKQKPHLTPITLNAILVEETSKPEDGGKPICWRLLTSLPIDSFEQARCCVCYYSYRWLIERFHYVLKSGCKIEVLQLQHRDRLLKALATYNSVATKLMSMTYQARLNPAASCEVMLQPVQWKLLRRGLSPKVAHRSHRPYGKPCFGLPNSAVSSIAKAMGSRE